MTERKLPAYPLFVKDPNFSLWSCTEELNSSAPQTWWCEEKPVFGFIKTGKKTYCFMGDRNALGDCGIVKAEQTSLRVTAFTTEYEFEAGNTTLKLRFVSPLPPNDFELLSMPVCYMEYEISGDKNAELSLFVGRRLAYNYKSHKAEKDVRGCAIKLDGFESAVMGLKRQLPLSVNDDTIGADWGYFYLAGERAFILDGNDLASYIKTGATAFDNKNEDRYIGAVNKSSQGAIMLGYDDSVSIDYFGKYLKGYYLDGHTIFDALDYVNKHRGEINAELERFDSELKIKAREQGENYIDILYAALRQSVAAHKLVKDGDGNILFLSKECASNGCIGTVDVSYPSMPLYLLYAPELVKGMMRPILKFARMPVWSYDFAPHDVGTYPSCCGQVYALKNGAGKYYGNLKKNGGALTAYCETHYPYYLLPPDCGIYDDEYQMPVEECANMLIMFAACYRYDGDISFFEDNIDLAEKWVRYLIKYGLKPDNQLCTDDFAGHLKNNVNLAIKATVGIAAFAALAGKTGRAEDEKHYRKIAEEYAAEIEKFGAGFEHLPLTWDSGDETFSLKYNFAFDKILGLGLFKQDTLEREVDCYIEKTNAFGTPLDSRREYTKSDWLLWSARLTDDKTKREKLIAGVCEFLKKSPVRVPFSDWYNTENGGIYEFLARSVQGGCFILLL